MKQEFHHRDKVIAALRRFLDPTVQADELTDDTNMIADLGLSSLDGVDFVLELCDEFEFEFPKDFNPAVHPDGRRGLQIGELVQVVSMMLKEQAVTN